MLMVLLLTVFLVREVKQPKPTTATTTTPYVKKNLRTLIQNQLILILFLTTFFVQIVNMSISPILSLFVRQLNANPHTISFVAGLVAAMPGIATIIAAPRFGKLGDKIGSHRIAILGFCIAMVAFTATSLASNIPALMRLRFLTGVTDAAILPAVNSLLTKNTATSETSLVFAYNQSFQASGAVVSPILGALVANATDYAGVFISSALLMIVNLGLFYYAHQHGLLAN